MQGFAVSLQRALAQREREGRAGRGIACRYDAAWLDEQAAAASLAAGARGGQAACAPALRRASGGARSSRP
ncbi:hypothetical protein [Paraburkholderia lycopersici]|uniref:hypothetical protein n=1 Tax=Paraburkholderia lycopersici TaxID=416944 RepID=UPI000A8B2938|nr:hypothetical protein [Paraburkholderia lycopersici]